MLAPSRVAPIQAVFLGIDPAKHTSGATLLLPDDEDDAPVGAYVLEEFGKVETQSERERFVQALLDASLELKLPPVVVAETWDPPRDKRQRLSDGSISYMKDQKWTFQTILSMGAGWGKWEAEIDHANAFLTAKGLPGIIVVRVLPNDWRDDTFGKRRPRDTEALKVTAERYFEGIFGYAASSDISEAGCISLWGTTAVEVDTLVRAWRDTRPRARRKRSSR